jgi:hypothetical protein
MAVHPPFLSAVNAFKPPARGAGGCAMRYVNGL